ncbi:MAG: pyridoxine 5'-phosphate synthase [Terrimicrobiaceae bacterium]
MDCQPSVPPAKKIRLGVNIDHVATLRQARYRGEPHSSLAEPCPVAAALEAEAAGAHGITAHLRQDRRHIQDADIEALRDRIATKLNFEMGNTEEILRIALRVRPDDVCLVPESREEVTTEGGLDCAGQKDALRGSIQRLQEAGIVVSLFIDPDPEQIEAAAELGAEFVELHTGAFANATGATVRHELDRLIRGAEAAHGSGLRVNAGHGINYKNLPLILEIPHLVELNIGHSIVSRAVTTGMRAAVAEMLALMP